MAAIVLLCSCAPGFYRTELYLGLSKPGSTVSEAEFDRFLDDVVTPAFPDGYTVVPAEGRYRAPGDLSTIIEPSRVLIILRQGDARSDARIEAIRQSYKSRFEQTSVLRVDQPAKARF